jgi:hypothetical protein
VNVFEVNLYNFNKTVTDTFIDKIEVNNLTNPIEFAFPIGDNQNLTEFVNSYMALNKFKYAEKKRGEQMIQKSNLTCVFWNETAH